MKKLKTKVIRKSARAWGVLSSFFKWGICSIITGIICGIIGTAFHYCIDYATDYRTQYPWLLYFLPFAGLLIVFLYKITSMQDDGGTNRIISSIRTEKSIPCRMAPLIFISTVITHLFGGSAGREGAALQMGGSIGSTVGNFLKLKKTEIRIITMCGMSGVFAALFGTPITATIFSMEVISVGVLYYVAFVPCLISAVIALRIAQYCNIQPEAYSLKIIPEADILTIGRVAILSMLCALVSIIFCYAMHKTGHFFKHRFKNPYIRVFVGGLLIVFFTLLVQSRDYNGAGMNIVEKALYGDARPEAFLLKIIFTAITLAAGFKGGEIVPSFFIGATFGNVAGGLLGLDPGFGAAIGLIAMFCGVVNCPIASLFLSIELFGASGILLFCFACAISYVLSGYYGLYSSQKIVYSKLSPTYINKSTH